MAGYRKPYNNGRYGSAAEKKAEADQPNKKRFYKKQDPVVKIPFVPMATPTAEQSVIIEEILHGSGNLVVRARAGTGKTKTILQAISQLPSDKTGAYLVFGNRNAREAEAKMPSHPGIQIFTHHAFGYRAQKAAFGKQVTLDNDKMPHIITAMVGYEDDKVELCYNLEKAISLCKGYLAEDQETVIEVCDSFGVEYCDVKPEDFAQYVLRGMTTSTQQKFRLAFDDMIYNCVKLNVHVPQFDYVFIDEANDCSRGRLALSIMACKPGGRLIFCGDDRQCIFVFCGASLDTMDQIISKTNAKTLPMTITHRCCKSVVRAAQAIVPDYVAADSNPEGEVKTVTEDYMMENARNGDLVISRTNSALVPIAMQFWKQKKRCHIQGKDFSKNLLFTIKRSGASSVEGFLSWLTEWKDTEVEKLSARKRDYTHVTDKYEVLINLSDDCNTLDELKNNIRNLFDDVDQEGAAGTITASTTHRYKGMEADRVWMLSATYKPGKGAEEDNIYYVAMTRSKDSLFFVGGGPIISDAIVAKGEEEIAKEVQE